MAVDKPKIGIRQADGSFYEIMEESQAGHKRVVLSAARTDQHGVKIDLYRSTDGTLDPDQALGTIRLDDQEGLGYQDIEFRIDLDDAGLLGASAALPGQPPQTLTVDLAEFREPRSDAEILEDESIDTSDLDTLDADFTSEPEGDPEPMTLDLPELDELAPDRTDAEILGDESFDSAELDSIEDFGLEDESEELESLDSLEVPEEPAEPETEAEVLDDLSFEDAEPAELADFGELDDLGGPDDLDAPKAAEAFDLGDLDAGFGEGGPDAAVLEEAAPAADDWEKISLDDLEPMEFLDTGDEISSPSAKAAPGPKRPADEFKMDDEEPLELGDLDSDLSDLPELDNLGENDLDQDFLAPPALTELPEWSPGDHDGAPAKGTKKEKAPKAAKAHREHHKERDREEEPSDGSLDKTALFLSLTALVLLVILILVLLVLNLFRSPAVPVIQPEVQRWKPVAEASLALPKGNGTSAVDLGAPGVQVFTAASVLDVPSDLKSVRVAMTLAKGDTVGDAVRRFGTPDRVQGNQLYW